ncbi:recombinase family protein [Labrys sp. ZIDIC5]|uniref:recombinase family protein n=1 Tax=Labrys sedimenti TaxID=3106036 RepID=UPI002ACA77DD|nr:recombinase family protein [Labrys sp. ZIDIC5]MDZ5454446.1 recombinase family protein [Labrys sp. ZIDIC5]
MRACIYARYSSELQREASIEDQLRICRRLIADRGWKEAAVHADQGMSGSSHLRPGYQAMMQDARAGRFDILVAESLDRLSRDQEHIAALFKQLRFLGIPILTVAEGEISELHIGLKGTMSALYLKDLAQKTHRGLEGRVRNGKSAGGISYGYRAVRYALPDGSVTTGERVIDEEQAEIVRRIFRDYASGLSPRAIAAALNRDHVPGPAATAWGASTIQGNWRRGTGILNNELYIGRLVWNRQRFVKDPDTGKRQARLNPPEEWVVQPVPELELISPDLWQAVRERQGATRYQMKSATGEQRPERARRIRYLFSGLLACGCCGGAYTLTGANYYGCAGARNKGTCDNRRMIKREVLEVRVLEGLKQKLLHPDLIAAFVEEYRREYNASRQTETARRQALESELGRTRRAIEQIVEAIADGMYHPSMKEKMATLESCKQAAEAELAAIPEETPLRLHPNLAAVYRRKVEQLAEALNADELSRLEATESLRGLITAIRIIPLDGEEMAIELAAIMALGDASAKKPRAVSDGAYSRTLVAGAGFEPAAFRL